MSMGPNWSWRFWGKGKSFLVEFRGIPSLKPPQRLRPVSGDPGKRDMGHPLFMLSRAETSTTALGRLGSRFPTLAPVKRRKDGARRFVRNGEEAKTRTTAGPSTSLRFDQDYRFW